MKEKIKLRKEGIQMNISNILKTYSVDEMMSKLIKVDDYKSFLSTSEWTWEYRIDGVNDFTIYVYTPSCKERFHTITAEAFLEKEYIGCHHCDGGLMDAIKALLTRLREANKI